MMNETGLRRILPDQSSGSHHSFGTPHHRSIIDPILSKRVCFYKSGDPQFNGLRMVINNRTFKTFDALLDSLSKKVPLPFGVRNITTPRGVHAIYTLDELEDGKSYICSDSRKIKPINLAVARKKLPPWYHARPVSSRRRTVQQARFFPGRNNHKKDQVIVRTPKRLLVFRNGDPTLRHTVVLSKRTTPTFEAILEYISELIQFPVVKLHTPDGRRVDGLPSLILCSGTVVAAGKEPFRPANYNAQKIPAPAMLPTNRMSVRRVKAFNRKNKASISRKFSPSSERYILNRIYDSIAESSFDLPSNPTNSVEMESGRILESVAETEGDTCLGGGAGGKDGLLPAEDDIEKSFRVNQDGSMTVEMRVRLTIKEEETIHWTTTLSRSSVANQLNVACLPEPEEEQEISSLKSNSLDLQSPAGSVDTINKDKTEDNDDEDPPSLGNGASSESCNEEDNIKVQGDMVSPRRAPTPGHKQIRKKQASVESITSLIAEGVQEGMVGSYSYREQTENGATTEKYCMVKQSTTKPVPKPRRFDSLDTNSTNLRNVSTFKSAGMTEITQIESSGEEVTETVLHIYEQQTCQDNFLANICAQSISTSGITFGRPASSGTGQLSSSSEFEPEPWRPSTASESVSIWRAESMSVTSDVTLPSLRTGGVQQPPAKPTKEQDKSQQREDKKDKRASPKPRAINKRVRRLMSPGKRPKGGSSDVTEKQKKVKTFSSAGFIKKIYGNKSKSARSMMKVKREPARKGDGGVTTKSTDLSDDTTKSILKVPNIPSEMKEKSEAVSLEKSILYVSPNEASQPRGILVRQTSVHQEKKNTNESNDVSKNTSLPAFNSCSSVSNEYVSNWLEKAHLNPAAQPDKESQKSETATLVQAENGRCVESQNNKGLLVATGEETSDTQTLKTDRLPETVRRGSVKQRIQTFENKSSSPSAEKTTINQQTAHSRTITTNAGNCSGSALNNVEEIKPLSKHCPEIIQTANKTSAGTPSGMVVENKSSPIKISLQKATPSNTLSMELPPPPPPAEDTEIFNSESCVMDASSVASSPLYRLSSVSSQMSDNHPLSISPASDKAESPTNLTVEVTASIQTDIPSTLEDTPLQRAPSIKRAPLVSNLSLDRKMSLRKACLDKYALCSDATSETTASSPPVNTAGDNVLPNGICSARAQQSGDEQRQSNAMMDLKNSPSCCSSTSPCSLTSEERMSSDSISSSESPPPLKEAKTNETPLPTHKEASSPKPPVKKVTLMSSPSPERKSQTKKISPERPQNSPKLSPKQTHPHDKTMSPNIGQRKHATPNASPSSERKQALPNLQKRLSPYSQSLDMVSPPARHKSNRKLLSRNLSSENASEPTNKTQRKASPERKRHQSIKTVEPDKSLTHMPMETDGSEDNTANRTDDLITADQERSVVKPEMMLQPLNTANQPNIKPVLAEICYSIKSIRQMTQNKRPSCLEKSNSLPDFSSHVASTFGSSSKALLAFLAVMTLKEGIANLNTEELNANNVSCAEALKMIDSLREIACIEDSHQLKASLSNLQQSASKQLLQSWRGFQELSDKCKSRSSTPNDSEQELITMAGPGKDYGTDEYVIDEIMDNLDIPEKLKEELASLSVCVKSDSDDEERISARITEKVETSAEDNTRAKMCSFTEDVTQHEKVNVDVNSIIKKFSDINQPKQQSSPGCITSKYGHNVVTKCSAAEAKGEHEGTQSTKDSTIQEKHEALNEDASNHEKKMNGVVRSRSNLQQDGCSSEEEEKDMEGEQLQQSEESMSIPEDEFARDNESSSEQDEEQKMSCERRASSSETGEQRSSEEEPEGECEEIREEIRDSDDVYNPESTSEEEEEKQPSSSCYVEMNVRGNELVSSPNGRDNSLSEEEQPEVYCTDLSNKDALSKPASPPDSDKEAGCTGPDVSVDESTCNSDGDEPYLEEEPPKVKHKELKVIVEESLSDYEEEQESTAEEEHVADQTKKHEGFMPLIEESAEDKVSSDGEIENQGSYTKDGKSGLIKRNTFSADEDSGNDHSSCEDHVEAERPKAEDRQISSSLDEELSFYEKESSSEEEHADVGKYTGESCAEYEEASVSAAQSDATQCEKAVGKLQHPSGEIMSQSIAERVTLLEKHVAETQRRKNSTESSPIRRCSQRTSPLESDLEESASEMPKSESALSTRSAPQSSLSFSYDSSGVITTEPEGSRVRSIREMFLAKSATDIQPGPRRFPSPNTSQLSEFRAQTSASGGYQSQTSSELSSGEDDSARKSITKGFVRRTIERLYGKKESRPDEEECERPPSAPKQKKKEHSSIFSPFHIARTKAMSELSYFNSTNTLDTLTEATRCVAFNAQVRPEDGVPIDTTRWLLRENTLIRKSVSDPVSINKTYTNSPHGKGLCEDTEENIHQSLCSTKSEVENKKESFSTKCTYFSLPHASDSDACQEDLSTVSRSSANGDSVADAKDNAERNGTLPGVSIADFKMMDNKVHPLKVADGEVVVVVQPGRGQGVVNRRLQEPDMLDLLYNFCGQNCPIL